MKPFYSEEMLEMICNYGRYTREYIPISGSRWRFSLHRTAQYCQGFAGQGFAGQGFAGGGGEWGRGYHIMAVRHDNVVMYSTGCLCHSCNVTFLILRILVLEPH